MAIYYYLKAKPKKASRFSKRWANLISTSMLILGVIFISQAILPILGWYFLVMPSLGVGIASPLSSDYRSPILAFPSIVKAMDQSDNSYKPTAWFMGAKGLPSSRLALKVYSLSIPKLKIDGATVEIGGENLKKSLVAWGTSSVPGTYGNNIIFGHSELPQFASPKDYSGIFTSLMTLENGDDVFVDYDGIRYRYQVIDKSVIEPTNLSVLEQRFDAAYVTLITCVPPGTLWKRGVIRAKLSQI